MTEVAEVARRADVTTDTYLEWKGWLREDFGRVSPDEAAYFARELSASGVPSIGGLRVGELGYGNGAFAGWIRTAGGFWTGREAIAALQQRAKAAGYAVVEQGIDFSDGSGGRQLDLMVAFDVIEHLDLPAVRGFLREASEALRPGGLLLFRCPSGDSPFSQAAYCGDVTHRTLLGSSAIRQLAEEAGLHVEQIRSPVLPLEGVGVRRMLRRVFVRAAQAVAFRFIRTVLMGNSSAVLNPNMFVVIRKPKC